ncbi:hypothetical protein PILCRDRAFT_5473 [Piloderma croceum F 1598]|uniref:BTB domain-containing protein n=1 Tax=Piloderma croceum (strain F 1598) TaxID=765440 RepID=A0A0C3G5C7_PILCF|nr:hypothetical protein PILCRDRAFT_5473 [Piloderma croceum F 1598]
MWSLDIDNIPHPHLSFQSSDSDQSSNVHLSATHPGSSTAAESDQLYQRHPEFFFADDNVIFQVENTRYKMHRYFFQRDSEIFASIFALPTGPGQGSSEYNPIRLVGVKIHDFDLFLSMLYPHQIGVYSATTVDEWTAILNLAAKWKFESIKDLAIRQLALIGSPIDKIVLGQRHGVTDWLLDSYRAICERSDALTLDEANRLGMENVVKISSLRQDIRRVGSLGRITVSLDVLKQTFGLEGCAKEAMQTNETCDDGCRETELRLDKPRPWSALAFDLDRQKDEKKEGLTEGVEVEEENLYSGFRGRGKRGRRQIR